MTAPGNALEIDAESPPQRLELAAELLTTGAGRVLLNGTLALRRARTGLVCDVLDDSSSSRRCEHEFEVIVENAQRMLESSPLAPRLPDIPRRWAVIADDATAAELWRAP